MSSYGKTQIACRVCDSVFLSTKALIDHLDSHIVDDEAATARIRQHLRISHLMSSQRSNPFTNPRIQPNPETTALPFQSSPQIQHQQPFFNHNQQFYSPDQAQPVPYKQRDPFKAVPPPYSNPNRNSYPNPHAYSSLGRNLNTGFGAPYMVPSSQQTTLHMAAMEYHGDCTRPFLSQLEYPILPVNRFDRHSNCNGNSNELDLDLKL